MFFGSSFIYGSFSVGNIRQGDFSNTCVETQQYQPLNAATVESENGNTPDNNTGRIKIYGNSRIDLRSR